MAIADIAKPKTQVSALPTLVCFSHAVYPMIAFRPLSFRLTTTHPVFLIVFVAAESSEQSHEYFENFK